MILLLQHDPGDPDPVIRNDQCGDWWYNGSQITATARNGLSEESALMIAIHELIEAFLCRKKGIPDSRVCEFDEQYEADRKAGKHPDDAEPGDHPHAPYRQEHQAATFVERAVGAALGVSWQEHEKAVGDLEVENP